MHNITFSTLVSSKSLKAFVCVFKSSEKKCNNMQNGDFIRINYIARLESGEIFDLTYEDIAKKQNVYNPKVIYRPIPIVVGAGFVIKGIDNALLGMNVGEKKSFDITPEDGFGQRNPRLVRVVPKRVFKEHNIEPVQGMVVDFSSIKGRIQSVSAGRIMVDFNNPLAGKVLKYELEVVEKIDRPERQISALLEFFGVTKAEIKLSEEEAEIESVPMPIELKNRISKLITEHVKTNNSAIKKVKFVEVFQ